MKFGCARSMVEFYFQYSLCSKRMTDFMIFSLRSVKLFIISPHVTPHIHTHTYTHTARHAACDRVSQLVNERARERYSYTRHDTSKAIFYACLLHRCACSDVHWQTDAIYIYMHTHTVANFTRTHFNIWNIAHCTHISSSFATNHQVTRKVWIRLWDGFFVLKFNKPNIRSYMFCGMKLARTLMIIFKLLLSNWKRERANFPIFSHLF